WTAAVAVMGALAGGAYAQSTPDTGKPSSTSPSTTPNDGSAVPPNTPVPPGQTPPAGETNPTTAPGRGGMDSGHTSPGGDASPGSKTGLPTDKNHVPERNEPGTTEPQMPNTGGKERARGAARRTRRHDAPGRSVLASHFRGRALDLRAVFRHRAARDHDAVGGELVGQGHVRQRHARVLIVDELGD